MQTVDFKRFPLDPGDRVLDLGCGEGRHVISAYLAAAVDAVGVDLRHDDLLTTRERLREIVQSQPAEQPSPPGTGFILSSASALALPFADNSFDKVICSEVLEHIPDYRAALLEIDRVLKPGGLFCASVPRRWPERLCWAFSEAYHKVPGGHVRIFKAPALRREIESLGMRQYHRHWAHALHAPFWWLKCLFWSTQDSNWLIRQYHRLLVWDVMARPALTRTLERWLNPVMGKSVVMYFRKGGGVMSGPYLGPGLFPHEFLRPTVEFILRAQKDSGEIPWFTAGHSDPWDHVEAAMGLSIGGEGEAAVRAYRWLADTQLEDGSWWAGYRGAEIDNGERRETNFVAYFATGVWHHYLVTGDRDFLERMWPTVERAIGFVLILQTEHGDIHWAISADGSAREDALLTGCSSIYKSLECASNIAVTLGHERPDWLLARRRLGEAIRGKPERFDRTWESKARYSMDWFYPVLAGVLDRRESRARLAARWDEFVKPGLGCRCVSDEPLGDGGRKLRAGHGAAGRWRPRPGGGALQLAAPVAAGRRRLLDRLPVRAGHHVARREADLDGWRHHVGGGRADRAHRGLAPVPGGQPAGGGGRDPRGQAPPGLTARRCATPGAAPPGC